MPKGETRWNPSERKVSKNSFPVLPTNDYTLQSKANFRVACKDEPFAIPYVFGNVVAIGTRDESIEGSKDVSILLPFYLSTTPRAEDKKPAVDMGGGLTELCQILGLTPPEDMSEDENKIDEDGTICMSLNAAKVRDWLNNLGEFVVRGHVKKQEAKGAYDARNNIQYFVKHEVNTSFNVEPIKKAAGRKG